MRFEDLQYFQAVVRYRSFSKAADSLYISQSALSKRIKTLESHLGGALFVRKNNSAVVCTPFGDYISGYINTLVEDAELLSAAADNYQLNHQKSLHLAVPLSSVDAKIIDAITRFEAAKRNFYVETYQKQHEAIREMLEFSQVDLAFAYRELIGKPSEYRVTALFQDPLVFVTSKARAEALHIGGAVSFEDIQSERYCFPKEDAMLYSFYLQVCKNIGFVPELTLSDVRIDIIKKYIEIGLRSTLVPRSAAVQSFLSGSFAIVDIIDAPVLNFSMFENVSRCEKTRDALVRDILKEYQKA